MRFHLGKVLWRAAHHLLHSRLWTIFGASAAVLLVSVWLWTWIAPGEWEVQWGLARKAFAAGQHQKALAHLSRVKNRHASPQVAELRRKIHAGLEKSAHRNFRDRLYARARS